MEEELSMIILHALEKQHHLHLLFLLRLWSSTEANQGRMDLSSRWGIDIVAFRDVGFLKITHKTVVVSVLCFGHHYILTSLIALLLNTAVVAKIMVKMLELALLGETFAVLWSTFSVAFAAGVE